MMRQRESNGAKLFLTELMFSIFFFAVIAAICVQLFSGAHTRSVHSKELVQSVNLASNVAEYYTVWDWEEESWQKVFPEGEWQGDVWQASFDESWEPCEESGEYLLQMEVVNGDEYREAYIAIMEIETERVIYELAIKRVV